MVLAGFFCIIHRGVPIGKQIIQSLRDGRIENDSHANGDNAKTLILLHFSAHKSHELLCQISQNLPLILAEKHHDKLVSAQSDHFSLSLSHPSEDLPEPGKDMVAHFMSIHVIHGLKIIQIQKKNLHQFFFPLMIIPNLIHAFTIV